MPSRSRYGTIAVASANPNPGCSCRRYVELRTRASGMRQYDERARADHVMRFRLPLALDIRVAGVEHDLPRLAVRPGGQRDRRLLRRGVEEDQERVVGDRLAARAGLGDALAVEEDR